MLSPISYKLLCALKDADSSRLPVNRLKAYAVELGASGLITNELKNNGFLRIDILDGVTFYVLTAAGASALSEYDHDKAASSRDKWALCISFASLILSLAAFLRSFL